jgi:hypothetical protein
LERLDREVSFKQPTLFISHLTAAHWPYYTASTPFGVSKATSPEDRPMYRIGLQTADQMFGELLAMLERKGALQNAIVIVLSDHGEALGLMSDSFFDETFFVTGMKAPLKMDAYGHGQSVLSKSQYQVLLGLRTYGSGHPFTAVGRRFEMPITVEDIAPTILDFLGEKGDPLAATGQSFLPYLKSGIDGAVGTADRIRYTETDLRVLPGPGGGVDEVGTAQQNSAFFEVDPKTARLHIREKYRPLALAYKERAAYTKQHLLAAMPAGPYAHQYLYFDFARKHGQLLLGRPDENLPEARRLWDAMNQHYGDELKKPVVITREDWPRIMYEWQTFIEDRQPKKVPQAAARVNAG